MNKTANYNLNQWEKSDRVLMEDFNNDNAKIDAALKEAAEAKTYVIGKYTGTGVYPREISLGFQPSAVVMSTYAGITNNAGSIFGGVFAPGMPLGNSAEVTDNGFLLKAEHVNNASHSYHYIAFQ